MALTITTTITVADDEAYTAREQAILAAIAAHPAGKGITPAVVISNPVADAPAEKIAAGVAADARIAETRAAAKAKAAAAAEAKAEAQREAESAAAVRGEEPATEVDNDAEALAAMEADLAGEAPTLEDAVTQATKLVSEGKAAQVKAALLAAGAKRVSELSGAKIATFLTALAG